MKAESGRDKKRAFSIKGRIWFEETLRSQHINSAFDKKQIFEEKWIIEGSDRKPDTALQIVALQSCTLECLIDVPSTHGILIPIPHLLLWKVSKPDKLFETIYLCWLFCDSLKGSARLYCFVSLCKEENTFMFCFVCWYKDPNLLRIIEIECLLISFYWMYFLILNIYRMNFMCFADHLNFLSLIFIYAFDSTIRYF